MKTKRYVLCVDPSGIRDIETGEAHDPFTTYSLDPLRHLVWSSLYCDARLSSSEQPDRAQRGGWWPGVAYGSTMHAPTIRRGVLTPATLAAIRDAADAALTWMVEDGLASDVTVEASRANGLANLNVIVQGPSTGTVGLRYSYLWSDLQ